jgi:hypothetical protein
MLLSQPFSHTHSMTVRADGFVSYASSGTVHLVADLDGYCASGAPDSFVPYGPARIAGTRAGIGLNGQVAPVPEHGTLQVLTDFYLNCNPQCSSDAADVLNVTVTVTQPQAAGFLTVYPYGTALPGTSNVNFTAGQTIANVVTTQNIVSLIGIGIYNGSSGTVQIVVDEEGYFIDQQ